MRRKRCVHQRSQKWAPFINIRSYSVFSRVVFFNSVFSLFVERLAPTRLAKLHISILGIVHYPIGKHAPYMKLCQRISTSEDIAAVENMLGELEAKGLEVGSIVNELDLCKLSKMYWFDRLEQERGRPRGYK